MIGSRSEYEGSGGSYRTRRAPLGFPGAAELAAGSDEADADVDWDALRVVGLIERQGSVSTEVLDADWE
ncbi:MAG TPA: hypothetical protein VF859_01060 [Burkholderiales bacterium]